MVEAANCPPLRGQLTVTGKRVNVWFTNWVRIAGSADPGRDAPIIINHWTGIVLHQLARPQPGLQPATADLGAGDRPDPAPARGDTSMTAHPVSPILLDRSQAWQVIDAQRLGLAGLLDDLSEHEWQQPSLCDGWTVRDVAAHLTLQQLGARAAIAMMLRYRGDTDRAIRECACQRAAALSTGQITAAIRGMTGLRWHNFGVTYRETLIDILVHAQDIAIPLGRCHPIAPEAAAAAVTRIWTMRWPPPFPSRRTMQQFRITATDITWAAGHGPQIQAPISAILLLSAGRLAALPQLAGDGAAELTARLRRRACCASGR